MTEEIIIVGAGMAGLSCAAALAESGRPVRLLEKSRAPGGRAATRRRGGPAFDHGAPCAHGGGAAFADAAAGWQAAGCAAPWPQGGPGCITGIPGMRDLVAPLARGLAIETGVRVTGLSRAGGGWRVATEGGAVRRTAAVVLALPAPQAAALLPVGWSVAGLAAVEMAPCWSVMLAVERPLAAPDLVEGNGAPLALAIRDSAKPGRARRPETWVLHAGADWTRCRIDAPPDRVAAQMTRAFADRLGAPLPGSLTLTAHRWRFARVARPLGRPCHWDAAAGLGLAGDWCEGPGLPAAWESGRALAARILAEAGPERRA